MNALRFLVLPLAVTLFTALAAIAGMAGSPELPELDGYTHINTLVVPEADSPIHGIHHFYINSIGRSAFQNGVGEGEEYPAGTIIVGKVFKPVHTDKGRIKEGGLAAYTLMEKAPGPDTNDTGGWRFVMYTPKGESKGVNPAKDCFPCHKPHADSDYVLSTPLD